MMLKKNEKWVLVLGCLNNEAVHAFETGNLDRALRLFTHAVNCFMKRLKLPAFAPSSQLSKTELMAIVRLQLKGVLNDTFTLTESGCFATRGSTKPSEQPSSAWMYQRVLRIAISKTDPFANHSSPEHVAGTVLLNIAICHHLMPSSLHKKKAVHYYEFAFKTVHPLSDLVLPQVIIWNNLFQIYVNELPDPVKAKLCRMRLEDKLHSRGVAMRLSQNNKDDLRSFLFNLFLNGSEAELAAAA
jgi:hypothetical protein